MERRSAASGGDRSGAVTAADGVLLTHFGFVAFVVVGLALVWLGAALGWRWVRRPLFRYAHLAAIALVAFEAILGITCPLTVLEDALRGASGTSSFVARWVRGILYHDLPEWVFTVAYVTFAAATAWTLHAVPPDRRGSQPR